MKEFEALSRLSEICRRKHLALATEKSYSGWVLSYIGALPGMPQRWSAEKKVASRGGGSHPESGAECGGVQRRVHSVNLAVGEEERVGGVQNLAHQEKEFSARARF